MQESSSDNISLLSSLDHYFLSLSDEVIKLKVAKWTFTTAKLLVLYCGRGPRALVTSGRATKLRVVKVVNSKREHHLTFLSSSSNEGIN